MDIHIVRLFGTLTGRLIAELSIADEISLSEKYTHNIQPLTDFTLTQNKKNSRCAIFHFTDLVCVFFKQIKNTI